MREHPSTSQDAQIPPQFSWLFEESKEQGSWQPKYLTERDMEDYSVSLPDEIVGSKKTYSGGEMAGIISYTLTGAIDTDRLTSTNGIRDKVEKYMKDRIVQAYNIYPDFFKRTVNPYTGRPLDDFHDYYVFADQMIRFSMLSPDIHRMLEKGYENMTPKEREAFLKELAIVHGRSMYETASKQDHLYLRDQDFTLTAREVAERRGELKPHLNEISSLRDKYMKALASGDSSTAGRIRNEAMMYTDMVIGTLGTEYKIHIHPQLALTPTVVDRILMAARMDPYLRNNISALKIARTSNKEENYANGVIPNIVIYPRRRNTPAESGEVVQLLTERLAKHLADLDTPEANANEVPRFNLQLTPIIFLAQSGGDLKECLRDLGLLDRYFDSSKNYGVLLT